MPRAYRRSYRRSYRRYYPFYRRRWSSRYRRRYSRSSGVTNSRSRMRVRIPLQAQLTCQIPANGTAATAVCIAPFCDTTNRTGNATTISNANGQCFGFTHSDLFRAYAALFDEVKFDGMRVKASVVETIGAGGNYSSLCLGSVIERNLQKDDVPPNNTTMNQWSSYSYHNVINNSVAKITRSVWASDLNERITFTDTDIQGTGANTGILAPGNALRSFRDGASTTFFSPAIYLTIVPPTAFAALRTVNFWVELVGYFTFRCPKYSSSGSTKQADDLAKLIESTKEAQVEDESFDKIVHEDTLLDIPPVTS